MQTFLPYADFAESARCLDRLRLNKQIVEARQIITAINRGPDAGWYNHPAVQMWVGYTEALTQYIYACVAEWHSRGYTSHLLREVPPWISLPPWIGDERLHSSHRAALLAKNPNHYGQFGWKEDPAVKINDSFPYFWPTKHDCY